jgi:glycosyltransferase involved in cell wall biosynthesis
MATYVYNLANACSRLGHRVWVAQKTGVTADPLERDVSLAALSPGSLSRVQRWMRRFEPPEILHQRKWSIAALRHFEDIQRSGGLDVVQVPDYNGESVAFQDLPFKLVVRLHTPSFLVDRLNGIEPDKRRRAWYALEGEAIMRADGITASSVALKKEVCAYYRIPEHKVTVIRNPVDTLAFRPPERRRDGEEVVMLYVGRLERRKGMDLLLPAAGEVLARHRNARFVFAGGSLSGYPCSYTDVLQSEAAKYPGRVTLLGALERERLPEVYRDADIFIIPSVFDNSPNSLFEAMASGLACVGGDVGGVNEIIRDGETGLLFDPGRPGSLTERIASLIRDPQKRLTLGKAAREAMIREHDPLAIAGETVDYYRGLTGKTP